MTASMQFYRDARHWDRFITDLGTEFRNSVGRRLSKVVEQFAGTECTPDNRVAFREACRQAVLAECEE